LPPSGPPNRPLQGTYPCPSCRGHFGSRLRAASVYLRLGEVRAARVDDARVGEHVDQRRAAAGERALERRLELAGRPHELAVAAERLDHLVVARLGPQL